MLNLKTAFDRCGQMHQRHYERILTHLNTQNQNQAQYSKWNMQYNKLRRCQGEPKPK